MASGGSTGGKPKRSADPKTDDPSIIGISNSHPGASGRQNNQKSQQSAHQSAQGQRQKQDRQTPQQTGRRSQQYQQRTPTSNEKRRQEHWKVPHGNSRHSPLAKDLFGADSQIQFGFPDTFQASHPQFERCGYGYGSDSGYYGGKNSQNYGNYGKNNQGFQRYEGQGSKGRYRQHNGGPSQSEKGKNLNQKSKNSTQNSESERKVQFIETLMKTGEKEENLTITVTDKPTEKKTIKESKTPEKSGKQSSTKPSHEEAKKRSPANKFINPLMSEVQGKKLPELKTSGESIRASDETPDKKIEEIPEDSASVSENVTDKGEKKKKRRNRDKKKKKDKHEEVQQDIASNDSRPSSQASNMSAEKKEKKVGKDIPDEKEVSVKVKAEKEVENKEGDVEKTNQEQTEQETKGEHTLSTTEQDERTKKLEELGLEQAEKRLEKDMIFKLEKLSPTFPEAKYFCKLCSHHLNTVSHAHKHIKDKRHKKESKSKQQDELLRKLKSPPAPAIAALDRYLLAVIEEKMLSEEDTLERRKVLERLDKVVSKELPGCSVVSYGSSVTRIGLKNSDMNVDVQYDGKMRTPAVLMSLLKILKESHAFTDVQEDFDAKVPRIEITDKPTNLRCSLSMNNIKALHTTRLLKIYGQIEPTVIKLSMLFRLWSHLCQVDRQQDGSLPPHSFALMVIFYLQQKYGLPVLHEVMADHDVEIVLEEAGDEHGVLIRTNENWWYYPTAPPADKKHAKEAEEEETAEFSESDDDLEITFSESPTKEKTVHLSEKKVAEVEKPLVPVKLGKCFADGNSPSLAELWLGILKFYSAQFDMENLIITVRTSERVTRSDRGWSHRRIAIEDPCSPKWNLCKPMNSQALFNYFITRLKHSVFYFHTAHNSIRNRKFSSRKHPKTEPKRQSPKKSPKKNNITISGKFVDEYVDTILHSVYSEFKGQTSHVNDDQNHSSGTKPINHETNGNMSHLTEEEVKGQLASQKSAENGEKNDVTDSVSGLADSMIDNIIGGFEKLTSDRKEEDVSEVNYDSCYKFTKQSLMDGKVPVIVCSVCKKEGHRKKNCPDEVKIKVNPLPPLTEKLRKMLDIVCREMYNLYVPQEEEVKMREKVCSDLFDYLRRNYDENVRMCLFGSSRNRFTFRGSDLDICMTFDGNKTGEDLNYAEVIENLAKILRRDPNLHTIIPITTAKVPIVKFYHPKAHLEGDISLYNLLAQRNTSMLALYASIDDRCRLLGYAMKAFVKRCCIGDASRGSLSSYAYILMVIYFLQQRDPPVLPVLQELYTEDKMPEHIVDGWNSWFYDSIGNLNKVWPEFGRNKESLGKLWIGMLRFYTEMFDFSRNVISIRQKRLLTAFEKEWTSKCICIEDPFDLSHNLGAGVSRKMTNFILKVFVKGRERFGTDPGNELNGFSKYQHYFFNAEVLMDGQEVPNDRCCRICGKIGHFVKDCPKRRQRGKKNGDETKLREIECFSCGKKGHFKKDCQEPRQGLRGSPMKDGPYLQHRPLRMPMVLSPHQPMMMAPLMQNMGQGSPVIVQAKRMGHPIGRFPDSQAASGARHPSQTLQKTQENSKKKQNQPQKEPTESKTHQKPPNNAANKQQDQAVSSPPSNPPTRSPYPSNGPNSNPIPKVNPNQRTTTKPVVNRNLSGDFDSEKVPNKKSTETPTRPSTTDPSSSNRRGLSLKQTNERSKQQQGNSPSPGAVYTVTEIESQMLKKAKGANKRQDLRPKVGDSLNHLIPKQNSNEEKHHSKSPGYTSYANYAHSPPFPPFGMPPFSTPTPPMYGGQYIPPYSTSPQNRGNPFQFSPHFPPPGFQRNHSDEGLSRTPPSPFNHPRMQSPNGISPPTPGYGFQQPHQGHRVITPEPINDHIAGRTFVNSNKGGRREVHLTSPNSAPPYYSYPPDWPHPSHTHGAQHWSGPNPRK